VVNRTLFLVFLLLASCGCMQFQSKRRSFSYAYKRTTYTFKYAAGDAGSAAGLGTWYRLWDNVPPDEVPLAVHERHALKMKRKRLPYCYAPLGQRPFLPRTRQNAAN